MDEPRADELADPAFRRRFVAAYRGPHDPNDVLAWMAEPDAAGAEGRRRPEDELRTLMARAYRPDPAPVDVDRLRRAQEAAAADAVMTRAAIAAARAPVPATAIAVDPPARPSRPPRPRLRWVLVPALVAAIVTGSAGFALGAGSGGRVPAAPLPKSAQEELRDKVAASPGQLVAQDYYRIYPDDLPLYWGGAATGSSHRNLSGEQDLEVSVSPVSQEILVIVTCPLGDGTFTWSRIGDVDARVHVGACGQLAGEQMRLPARRPDGRIRLRVAVAGPADYGVTILER